MTKLKAGDVAPSFGLQDQQGKIVRLSDYRGEKVLVYFYPRADTPGCTVQACSIRDNHEHLTRLGVHAIGISPDRPESQLKFDMKFSLGFSLLSDPDKSAAGAYGALKAGDKILRSSFLVDEQGRILEAWYGVKPEETVPRATEKAA